MIFNDEKLIETIIEDGIELKIYVGTEFGEDPLSKYTAYRSSLEGYLHRTEGPAFIRSNGLKAWYLNGYLHRKDGPAVEYSNGKKSYRLNGCFYSYEEFLEIQEDEIIYVNGKPYLKDGRMIK